MTDLVYQTTPREEAMTRNKSITIIVCAVLAWLVVMSIAYGLHLLLRSTPESQAEEKRQKDLRIEQAKRVWGTLGRSFKIGSTTYVAARVRYDTRLVCVTDGGKEVEFEVGAVEALTRSPE